MPNKNKKRWDAKRARHFFRWTLFHVALVVFFLDLIATIWGDFDKIWRAVAHIAVAIATVLASFAEWIAGMEEREVESLTEHRQEQYDPGIKTNGPLVLERTFDPEPSEVAKVLQTNQLED